MDRSVTLIDFTGFDRIFRSDRYNVVTIVNGNCVDLAFMDVTLDVDLSGINPYLREGAKLDKVILNVMQGFLTFYTPDKRRFVTRIKELSLTYKPKCGSDRDYTAFGVVDPETEYKLA